MTDDWKAVPCSSSELIRLGGTNFFNMQGVQDLYAVEMAAPAFHRRAVEALKASGKIRDDGTHDVAPRQQAYSQPRMKNFGRGARVLDMKRSAKCTIIHANAGYTKNSHIPVHRVADRSGDTWLARQDDLKLLL